MLPLIHVIIKFKCFKAVMTVYLSYSFYDLMVNLHISCVRLLILNTLKFNYILEFS